jgi:hypothetical protein
MKGHVMEQKTLLLLISISMNVYLALNLVLSNDKDMSISDKISIDHVLDNEGGGIANKHAAAVEEKGVISALENKNNELVQSISLLEKERENCVKELKVVNLKLDFSSIMQNQEEKSISNTIDIDESMSEELQQDIANYAAHLINEETDEAWEINVINTLNSIVEGEAFQALA